MSDPYDPEDVLKQDADPDSGQGGDDPADMVRYGLAARIYKPRMPEPAATFDAWPSQGCTSWTSAAKHHPGSTTWTGSGFTQLI